MPNVERESGSDAAVRRFSSTRRGSERRRLVNKAACGREFYVTSRSFPRLQGCYSQMTQFNGERMYSPSRGKGSSNYVIGATQGDINDPHDLQWTLVYADPRDIEKSFSLCQSVQSASTTHPANAIWACDLYNSGDLTPVDSNVFSVSCGCASTDENINTRLGPPLSTPRPRAIGDRVVLVFGVLLLCLALSVKLVYGRARTLRRRLRMFRLNVWTTPRAAPLQPAVPTK